MKGSLGTENAADVFLAVHLSKQNGVLRFTQKEIRKNVYFIEGSIVFAHSNLVSDRLGETLLRLGKITQEEFETASQVVIETGKRLGQTLCEKGYLSPGEVISGVHYQLQQIIYSVFNWEEGEYEFIEKERPVFEDIIVEVSTPTLLIDGIRHTSNSNVLKRSYGNDENRIVQRREEQHIPRRSLEFTEETLLACVDNRKSIASLRALAHLPALEFDRTMCSLLLSGLVRLEKGETGEQQPDTVFSQSWDTVEDLDRLRQARRAEAESLFDDTTRRMESDSGKAGEGLKTFSEEEVRNLILETERKFREASDEEVLEVLPDPTEQEIQNAYDHLNSLFRPHYESTTRFGDLREPLNYILTRILQAYNALLEKRRMQLPLESAPLLTLDVAPVPDSLVKSAEDGSETPPPEPTIAELQNQLRKDPASGAILRNLGLKLQKAGSPAEGEKQLLRALEIEPQNVACHFALAEFYQAQGLRMRAFKHLNIVMQLDPTNEKAIEMLGLKKRKKALFDITPTEE